MQEVYKEELKIELIGGVLVTMSPRPNFNHLKTIRSIFRIFDNYLIDKDCDVYFDGADVYLSEQDRFVPDLIVVCDDSIIKDDGVYGAPDLVVEVLSPSTFNHDRGRKKDVYGKSGVKEYWIVDPKNFSIEIYLPADGRMELMATYTIFPTWMLGKMEEEGAKKPPYTFSPSLFPGLEINIEEVFEDILPDDY